MEAIAVKHVRSDLAGPVAKKSVLSAKNFDTIAASLHRKRNMFLFYLEISY
jgi:hypothetical protein